jgi:hypothetical protein
MVAMTWYKKTALIFGCGFLCGMLTLNLVRVLVAEHALSRVLPHAAVLFFFLVIMFPVVRKSRDWFS